jgi:hypothetical protein
MGWDGGPNLCTRHVFKQEEAEHCLQERQLVIRRNGLRQRQIDFELKEIERIRHKVVYSINVTEQRRAAAAPPH